MLLGLEQGGPFSPKVFTATVHDVFKNAQVKEITSNVDGEKWSDLRIADDEPPTRESKNDLEHQLNTVKDESLRTGLNKHKRKAIFLKNIDRTDNNLDKDIFLTNINRPG